MPNFGDDFDDVVDVALGVGAARDGEADQVHFGRLAEHERANFYGTYAAFEVEFGRESYARKLFERDVGDEAAGVEVDGVASGRQDDGYSLLCQMIAKVGGGGYAVAQVVLIDRFLQAYGDGFEIASGEASVGGIAFGEDEQVFLLLRQDVVVGAEESTDVGHPIFFGAHGASVTEGEHFLRNLLGRFVFVSGLAELDEIGILGEAAGVEVERYAVLAADGADGAGVGHGDGLAASGIVGNGEHDERDALASNSGDGFFEGGYVHVALERMDEAGLLALGDHEVESFGTDRFDIGAGGVEVSVVGHHVAALEHGGEEDALGGPSLVSGNDVGVSEDALHGVTEADVASASSVAFIAFLNGSPLVDGHGSGAGVGEQIDQHIIGSEKEQIVIRGAKEALAVGALRPVNWLDTLDEKWFDDGADGHGILLRRTGYCNVPRRELPSAKQIPHQNEKPEPWLARGGACVLILLWLRLFLEIEVDDAEIALEFGLLHSLLRSRCKHGIPAKNLCLTNASRRREL